jgi:hypothetical protein
MLHYFKFRQDLLDPQPAKDVYIRRPSGKGWPEQCPPIRAANGFGWDLLANFSIEFIRTKTRWTVKPDVVIESDFDWSSSESSEGRPLAQQFAWFWEKGQKLPHVISDNVYGEIKNQVKISSYLFLKTDANELLLMSDIPNLARPFRPMSAIVDTDWYPASYPWHTVIELDPTQKRIQIKKGDPICRVIPLRRDTYLAQQMGQSEFNDFFTRGQQWLATHGQVQHEGVVDIARTYAKQTMRSKFVVLK